MAGDGFRMAEDKLRAVFVIFSAHSCLFEGCVI